MQRTLEKELMRCQWENNGFQFAEVGTKKNPAKVIGQGQNKKQTL